MAALNMLPRLVQTLPRELYDDIYNLTFSAANPTTIVIGIPYSLPSELQVDRGSGTIFARSYYSQLQVRFEGRERYLEWLAHLFPKYRHMITSIQDIFISRLVRDGLDDIMDWSIAIFALHIIDLQPKDMNVTLPWPACINGCCVQFWLDQE